MELPVSIINLHLATLAPVILHHVAVFLNFFLDFVRFVFIQLLCHPISYLELELLRPLASGYFFYVGSPHVLNALLELSVLELVQVCLLRLYKFWGC